ncbi:hypothetical protein LAUMK7_00278 [Mycobacterium kansasii]|uniref:Uncharacterized protein n=1 Tax=Mycobacterium kansasii TaxID=1768 RepID=A0A653ER48_MYCKA|nr:hypothetical protein LAUMK22_05334 [Mycobacterium kansasii]VAZ64259.1 hypothetical protein LAUMK40_00373 [Mycobacterium kansasii]VAZ70432.1 hypothetical protein LAUMK7_00278 [Mycobacterium kansasii]VTO99857.1 hypothetical protein BIN_B_02167 [Mycobacterium kansasii]BCI92501.1 hypothetical protein NIIDMKKI_77070 [Mycobacterium kansasii]
MHCLLWKLGERSQDAADRPSDRARNARHDLLNHLGGALGPRLGTDALELLGRIGFIRLELTPGIGSVRPAIQVVLGARRRVAEDSEIAGGGEC